jgi:peroxiredoxin
MWDTVGSPSCRGHDNGVPHFMNTVLITARFGLAAVFLVAALAKLADMPGSRRALEGFGVPARLVPVATVLLPAAELASAILLVLLPTALVGAAFAVALLTGFLAGIGAALRRGIAPDCHCFGQLHSKPAGKETLVRNGVLEAIAVFVLAAGPGSSLTRWLDSSSGDRVALAAVALLAILLAYVALSLWQENRQLTSRGAQSQAMPVLEVGQPAPSFTAVDLDGEKISSGELLEGAQRTVLVFTSATCGPCVELLPELARWRELLVGRLNIHVVAAGDEATNRRHSEEQGIPLLLDSRNEAWSAFAVVGTPSAIEVDESGYVAAPTAMGAPAIEGLIRAALKRPAPTDGFGVHHSGGASRAVADPRPA